MENVVVNKDVQELLDEKFKNGSMLESLHHYPRNGEEVTLGIDKELLPYVYDEVHLLSPVLQNERNIIYLYVEELIQMFPTFKKEGLMNSNLVAVVETLFLAMDFLTNDRFFNAPFTKDDKEELQNILKECFQEEKSHVFSTDANRPVLNKSKIYQNDEKVYALDKREEKIRIYMAVMFKKPESIKDHMKHVGRWLGDVHLKPNGARITYEEYMAGMTDHELHQETLFYIGMVKRTLSWLFNSCSWRSGSLLIFDEMDLCSKLGIRD